VVETAEAGWKWTGHTTWESWDRDPNSEQRAKLSWS